LQVSGQPEIPVVLGQVKGDKFVLVDSLLLHLVTFSSPAEPGTQNIHPLTPVHRVNISKLTFHLPENATSGMYRLILGKTRAAEILHQELMGFAIFA